MSASDARPTTKWFALLPFIALAAFCATMASSWSIAKAHGHVDDFIGEGQWPDISVLGIDWPEHGWFAVGFTIVGVVMATCFVVRWMQLRAAAPVARSNGRSITNGVATMAGLVAIACLFVMAWIPADVSVVHLFAALAAFGLLAIYELLHAALCWSFVREGSAGVALLTWLSLSPLGVVAAVCLWIVRENALWQYGAVLLLFAYFLPMSSALASDPMRVPEGPARAPG